MFVIVMNLVVSAVMILLTGNLDITIVGRA